MSTPTLYVPLRTGDITWPAATSFPATTMLALETYTYPENHIFPKTEVNNQYGSRSADGQLTTWKNIDISSLLQGVSRPKAFRVTILERNILADTGTGEAGDVNENPAPNGLYFDTYMSVDTVGGSNDFRVETMYTPNVSNLIGTALVKGFHTGRVRYLSGSWPEQTGTAVSAGESREGTFVVNPNFPVISISMLLEPIYPQDSLMKKFVGPINAIVKITAVD